MNLKYNFAISFLLALFAYEIDPDCMGNVLLWDRNGTPISKDIFEIFDAIFTLQ